ncbi:MAG: hypothetical protein U9R44_00485 [Candidatus Omnitrophota bacterium]|nr:hypothetical protein [Candidatus Omnitrophota bacterium]
MKKTAILLLTALAVMLVVPATSHAGPWTLKKGKIWAEVYTKYFFSKNYYDPKGEKHRWGDGGFSRIYTVEGKLEYGITDRFNVRLSVPYVWSYWKNDWGKVRADWGKFKNEGFQHIGLAAKYRFLDKPITAAAWGAVYIEPTNLDRCKQPDLIDYGSAIEARALLGKAFKIYKKPCYVASELGYRWQSNWTHKSPFANYLIIFGEGGIAFFDWLMLKGEVDLRYSHEGTGTRKDYCIWRVGPIFSVFGKGFSEVYKGGDYSFNVELQYGRYAWGRADGRSEKYNTVSAADEYIIKFQVLF